MIRKREMGESADTAFDRIIERKLAEERGEVIEDAIDDVDPVEDDWRTIELEKLGSTFMLLRKRVLKGLKEGKKTRSYYILKHFMDFITLNAMNSSDLKYFHKWVKEAMKQKKNFLTSEAYKKVRHIYNETSKSRVGTQDVLQFILKREGIKTN